MLKRLFVSLFICLLSLCVIGDCVRINITEFSENGANSVYECYEINPCIDEPYEV